MYVRLVLKRFLPVVVAFLTLQMVHSPKLDGVRCALPS
jgi:hypothetical protein